MFNSTKFIRRNATKSWKLAAILDFGGHFDFDYLPAFNTRINIVLWTLILKLVLNTKLLHQVEMTQCIAILKSM